MARVAELAGTLGIVVGLLGGCGKVVAPGDKADSAKTDSIMTASTLVASAVYDSLGPYTVIPLGTAPVDGIVQPTDVNDSNVVVGSISRASTQAFRWRNGAYELLAHPGGSASFATAINLRGDIVGVTSANDLYSTDSTRLAVAWNAGQKDPVALFPSESTNHYAVPRGISTDGAIVVRSTYPNSMIVLAPSTHDITFHNATTTPLSMNAIGDITGQDNIFLYPTLAIMDRRGTRRCTWGSHGPNSINALNDSGDVLVHLLSTSGPPPDTTLVERTVGGCGGYTVTPGYSATAKDLRLLAINNRRWLAGTIRGYQSVMILGVNGFASLDSVLRASGPASAAWHVNSILKINNVGTLLVRVDGAGVTDVPALLVPMKPR